VERNRRWVIAPRRLIISAVLSIAAIFVIFAALGLHNWQALAVGLAILAGAAALAVISAMTSKVRGVATVLEVNPPPAARYRGRVTATAVVRYKGRKDSRRVILVEDDVPLNKWPAVHDELPVVGLSNDLWSAEVLWALVPTHKRAAAKRRREAVRAAAAAAAATAAATATAPSATTGPGRERSGGGVATAVFDDDEPDFPFDTADDESVTFSQESGEPPEPEGPSEAVVVDAEIVDAEVVETIATETVVAETVVAETVAWSPPGAGKVVDGEWYETNSPDDAVAAGDITTNDEPPAAPRPPGAKPSPRPRRPPDAVVIGLDFGGSAATDTGSSAPATDTDTDTDTTIATESSGPSEPESVDAGGEPEAPGFDPGGGGPEPDPLATPAEPLVPQQSTGPRHAAPDDDDETAPVTAAADAPAARGHGAGDDHHGPTEDTMFGAASSPLRSSPLQVKRAGKLPPTVPAPRADDEPYDHGYDETAVAEGYRHALPPPGADPDQHTAAPDVTVQLFVSNLSRAIIFYRDILGFTEIDAGRKSAVLHLGDIRVVLKVVDDLLPSSKNVQFSLEVDDLEMAYEDLRARGVRFVHRPRRVEHYEQLEHFAAPFEDPDGHRISLSSWRAIYRADD